MTPKEKALELLKKFDQESHGRRATQRCAILCVDEMLKEFDKRFAPASHTAAVYADNYAYWFNVKSEIENL